MAPIDPSRVGTILLKIHNLRATGYWWVEVAMVVRKWNPPMHPRFREIYGPPDVKGLPYIAVDVIYRIEHNEIGFTTGYASIEGGTDVTALELVFADGSMLPGNPCRTPTSSIGEDGIRNYHIAIYDKQGNFYAGELPPSGGMWIPDELWQRGVVGPVAEGYYDMYGTPSWLFAPLNMTLFGVGEAVETAANLPMAAADATGRAAEELLASPSEVMEEQGVPYNLRRGVKPPPRYTPEIEVKKKREMRGVGGYRPLFS
jgi:hypothetical protein